MPNHDGLPLTRLFTTDAGCGAQVLASMLKRVLHGAPDKPLLSSMCCLLLAGAFLIVRPDLEFPHQKLSDRTQKRHQTRLALPNLFRQPYDRTEPNRNKRQ